MYVYIYKMHPINLFHGSEIILTSICIKIYIVRELDMMHHTCVCLREHSKTYSISLCFKTWPQAMANEYIFPFDFDNDMKPRYIWNHQMRNDSADTTQPHILYTEWWWEYPSFYTKTRQNIPDKHSKWLMLSRNAAWWWWWDGEMSRVLSFERVHIITIIGLSHYDCTIVNDTSSHAYNHTCIHT